MINLTNISTKPPVDLDEETAKEQTKKWAKQIADFQEVITAQKKYSILVILQGMDASGKDGAVAKVFKYCTPNGLTTYSFKKPTEEEFAHDFLWRVHNKVPAKGEIKVFNRSHYEDILIQRVHNWIDDERRDQRMKAINAFEDLITIEGNTILFKFFLHISHTQQEIELQQRIDEVEKNYKHNDGDWAERKHWDEYMRCYEYVLENSQHSWTIVPVDERWYRDYIISKTIVERLSQLEMAYPVLDNK